MHLSLLVSSLSAARSNYSSMQWLFIELLKDFIAINIKSGIIYSNLKVCVVTLSFKPLFYNFNSNSHEHLGGIVHAFIMLAVCE